MQAWLTLPSCLASFQEPNLGADDLLFGRHVVSSLIVRHCGRLRGVSRYRGKLSRIGVVTSCKTFAARVADDRGGRPRAARAHPAGWQGFAADWSSDQRAFKNVPWGSWLISGRFGLCTWLELLHVRSPSIVLVLVSAPPALMAIFTAPSIGSLKGTSIRSSPCS